MIECGCCGNANLTEAIVVETGVRSTYKITKNPSKGPLRLRRAAVECSDEHSLVLICPSCGSETQIEDGVEFEMEPAE